MNFLRKELFRKLFPLDVHKIQSLSKKDSEELICIFRKAERDIQVMGLTQPMLFYGIDFIKFLSFSSTPYVEIIYLKNADINENDINIMNMMLYMQQYKFPIGLYRKPLLPQRYCIGKDKE